jgi:hypothetical protein
MKQIYALFIGLAVLVGTTGLQASTLDKTGTQWRPYLEWSLSNPSYSGNPYELLASVTFTHQDSGEIRTTEMFYDRNNTWKFRFTGIRTGTWTFSTSSIDSDLNGKSGTTTINRNPDPTAHGFIKNFGNKWGWQGTEEAFVPQLVTYHHPADYYNNPSLVDESIQEFIVAHGFNGFHTEVFCRWFDLYKETWDKIGSNPNPDHRTFEALELLITKTHAAGGYVHIWQWGDTEAHATPDKWGRNGTVDKRLMRYIAARLGPLPGWTMGYGYDLVTYKPPLTDRDLEFWHDYMHQHMGWPHFLGARTYAIVDHGPPPVRVHPPPQMCEDLDYASYADTRPDYDRYVEVLEYRSKRPHFEEDRNRVRLGAPWGEKDYTEETTRRGLWHSFMAGGVANIWGNFIDPQTRKQPYTNGPSLPYAHPEWIKTCSRFFESRFTPDLERANEMTDFVYGQLLVNSCLKRPTNQHYIFYKEECSSIRMDLSGMIGAQPALAVDTKKPYAEINVGPLSPIDQTWKALYSSDWAIAVGDFRTKPSAPQTVIVTPTDGTVFSPGQEVTATGSGQNLSWDVDRIGDGQPAIATGTGSNITFTVPADSTSNHSILIRLTGHGGTDSQAHDILQPVGVVTVVGPADGGWPRNQAKIIKNGPNDFTVDPDGKEYVMVEVINSGATNQTVTLRGFVLLKAMEQFWDKYTPEDQYLYVKYPNGPWQRIYRHGSNLSYPYSPLVITAPPGRTLVGPYVGLTYQEIEEYVSSLDGSDPRITKDVVLSSGGGTYKVYRIKITNPGGSNKLRIAICKTSHAYERSGFYMIQGAIEWVLSGDPAANLDHIEWYFYPCLDPQAIHDGMGYKEYETLVMDDGRMQGDALWDPKSGELPKRHYCVLTDIHMWEFMNAESYKYNDPYAPIGRDGNGNSEVEAVMLAFWPYWYEFGIDAYDHENKWKASNSRPMDYGGALVTHLEIPFYAKDDIDPRERLREQGRLWARSHSQAYLRLQRDHGYWTSSSLAGPVEVNGAVFLPLPEVTLVEDLTPVSGKARSRVNGNGGRMKLYHEKYDHGIGMKAGDPVSYSVPPGANTFKAMVGVNDAEDRNSSVQFVGILDGVEVWRSRSLSRGQRQMAFFGVADASRLTLSVQGRKGILGNWGGAKFTKNDPEVAGLQSLGSRLYLAKRT